MADSKKRKRSKCTVSVLRCGACGAHAVAINDLRVTAHKCGGTWTTIRDERVEVALLHQALAQKEPSF